mmetsp:Transcript_111996/g.349030  ORF Transcript_111996/g.349030 Transcript_111996/m.349030 type:complete len:254 (+) Transcript_111996:628-1389(+)
MCESSPAAPSSSSGSVSLAAAAALPLPAFGKSSFLIVSLMMDLALRMSGSRSRSSSSCTRASRRSRRADPPKRLSSSSCSGAADCIFSRASRMMSSAFSLSALLVFRFLLDFLPAGAASSCSRAAAMSSLPLAAAFTFSFRLGAGSAFGLGASSASGLLAAGLALAALAFFGFFSAAGSSWELSGRWMPWEAQPPSDSRVLRASSREFGPASRSASSTRSGFARPLAPPTACRPLTPPTASRPWAPLGKWTRG